MKIKNIVLGFMAFTIAIGSAFASLTLERTLFVKVYSNQTDFEENIVTHISTSVSCEDTPPGFRCAVMIPLQSSSLEITDKTYKNKACSSPVFTTTFSTPLSGITPVYALAE
jgi:hypothetical protein